MITEITFLAESLHAETNSNSSNLIVTVDVDARALADKLDLDDRLHDLDPTDIADHVGNEELLEAIGEDEVRKWLLANSDPDDTLEYIGLDKIHEYLSHGTPDGDSPV